MTSSSGAAWELTGGEWGMMALLTRMSMPPALANSSMAPWTAATVERSAMMATPVEPDSLTAHGR